MGIGQTLGINPGFVAGAILSGAYFGDKLSPLSDTTNLASGVGGTDLFTHIRYMTITTLPSISIALVLYLIIESKSSESIGVLAGTSILPISEKGSPQRAMRQPGTIVVGG